MSLIDILAPYVGTGLILLGVSLLTHKHKSGWILRTIGSAIWTIYSLYFINIHVAITCFIDIPLNIYGWFKWRKNEKGSTSHGRQRTG
jgi:nicotinamide riboside transporter PnuC